MTGKSRPTASLQVMATQGGMELVHAHGKRFLRCPCYQVACTYQVLLTDLGELVDLGVTESDLRAHLESHTLADWLRVVRALNAERGRWENTARHAGICSWCECPRGQCVARWPHGKCCPDCEHGAEPQDEVVARCCALRALEEVATALQELDGDPLVDHDWTRKRVAEHLAMTEQEHAKAGDHDGAFDGHE